MCLVWARKIYMMAHAPLPPVPGSRKCGLPSLVVRNALLVTVNGSCVALLATVGGGVVLLCCWLPPVVVAALRCWLPLVVLVVLRCWQRCMSEFIIRSYLYASKEIFS